MAFSFDDIDRAIADTFGIAATLSPQVREQYTAGAANVDRPAHQVIGVFSAGPHDHGVGGSSAEPRSGVSSFRGSATEFWLPAEQVAALLPYKIKRGDKLAVWGKTYVIASPEPTDAGDLNLILTLEP